MSNTTVRKPRYRKSLLRKTLRIVWHRTYQPFIMGGNVHSTISALLECVGPYDLGKGFTGWLTTAPNGRTFVSENRSHGTVGETIEQVRKDVAEGDAEVMRVQIIEHSQEGKDIKPSTPEQFWEALHCQAPKNK